MADAFRTVAVFHTADEARRARARLEEAGVPVAFDVDPTAGWSWHDPRTVSIVQLSVSAEEQDRARELLALWVEEGAVGAGPGSAAEDEGEEWSCPKCGTNVEAFLDVCWACGTTRDGVEDPDFEPATAPIIESPEAGPLSPWAAIFLIACPPALVIYLLTRILFRAGAPEREPETAGTPPGAGAEDAGPVDVRSRRLEAVRRETGPPAWAGLPGGPDLDALLVRAWRTSVLGVLFFPPLLTIYSTWLVLKYFVLSDGAARPGQWRLYVSLAINLVVLLAVGYMVHLHLSRTPAGTSDAGAPLPRTVCRSEAREMAVRAA